MENHDKLYEQFKNAAKKSEANSFPAMEKVWTRVEEKLENKVLQKKNQLWKKLAIAASVLLLCTLGYQFFKPETAVIKTQQSIVNEPSATKAPSQPENKASETIITATSPSIKQEAAILIKKQIQSPSQIVSNETAAPILDSTTITNQKDFELAKSKTKGRWYGAPKFESNSVQKTANEEDEIASESKLQKKQSKVVQNEKSAPLYIIDGKAVTQTDDKKQSDAITSLAADGDLEDVYIYTNPLYIINGVEYSEESLFGKNPTSPYAPLNQQEIESTTDIKPENAIAIYGEKGKNGVVIITTKNKKPLAKKTN